MELDAFQIEEFNNHWQDTYCIHKGDIAHISEYDRAGNTVYIRKYKADLEAGNIGEDVSVSPNTIEHLPIRSGYYNLDGDDRTYYLCRLAKQQYRRGVSLRQLGIYVPTVENGIVRTNAPVYNDAFYLIHRMYYGSPQFDPVVIREKLIGIFPEITTFALTRNLCVTRDLANNVPWLLSDGVIIGHITDKNCIKLRREAAHMIDIVRKQAVFHVE